MNKNMKSLLEPGGMNMVVMRRQGLIGQKLIEKGMIDKETLDIMLVKQKESGEKLVELLVKEGYVSADDAIEIVAEHIGVKGKVLSLKEVKMDAFEILPENFMKKNLILPYNINGGKLSVVMAEPNNLYLVDQIQMRTSSHVKAYFCTKDIILKSIEEISDLKAKNSNQKVEAILDELNKTGEDEIEFTAEGVVEDIERSFGSENALIVRGINAIVAKAIKMKASDIHVEPYEKDIRIRYRVDGILIEVKRMPKLLINGLISRIKIMSSLDISEKRLPQDGRFRIKLSGRYVDFRVSTMPTAYGEKAVMRILDRSTVNLNLETLGFSEEALGTINKCIKSPYGIILVTGPTGSGKSTTLYSVLNILNTSQVNISTAEDPIEYELEGINQVQCRSEIGLTFASSLRSFLRQDPDIIMVGEIRDAETSEIAIKAALTGHLVFSTLHTNDAPSSIHRLINMGVEPFMISASILMVQAQRLVRKVCPKCREEDEKSEEILKIMGYSEELHEGVKFYRGRGCDHCNGTGYKGRAAIYEMMVITEGLKELISERATTMEIAKKAKEQGMKTLRESGLEKAVEGVTSLEEVLRVTLI